ncbi:peptidoglycan recognition family protein [Streptomyces sp. NPDC002088]|uniref:N-acetylmuramoyl-L-alanine amidase n=1 Tax=Streptomyces sp. NPDC002088 TaxID=3154665 RepID=UPI0033282A59
MSNPLSASEVVAALHTEGVSVVEYRDWRTHNRNSKGAFGPVNGILIHHTASAGDTAAHTASSVALCYNGRSDLPGPLCHAVGAKDGKVYLVGHGRANHAGLGDGDVLDAVQAEKSPLPVDNEADTDGNRYFYGIELINLGNGKDAWPDAQTEAAVRWAAALCRKHGWGAESVIGHKEWQPGKIDPTFDMDGFRDRVAKRLAADKPAETAKPATPAKTAVKKPVVDLSNVVAAAKRDPKLAQGKTTHAADVKIVEAALAAEGLLPAAYAKDGAFGTLTRTAYAKWQIKKKVGAPYDGIPGLASLTLLGKKYGFTVKA